MTIKILTVCAALAFVGCASDDQGGTDTDANRTYGTDSQIQTNGSNVSTNGTGTNAIPHQGLGAEQQTAPQTPQNSPSSGNRPL
jgi:hypothetical protein